MGRLNFTAEPFAGRAPSAAPSVPWLRDDTPEFFFPPMRVASAPALAIVLTGLKVGSFRKPAHDVAFFQIPGGFEAWFTSPLPSPQASISITGKLVIDEGGRRRSFTAADRKTFLPATVFNRVYAGGSVGPTTADETRIAPDGTFTAMCDLVLGPDVRELKSRVTVTSRSGQTASAEAVMIYSLLELFFAWSDSFESKMPAPSQPQVCHGAATPLEFLSSMRKMFQPPPVKDNQPSPLMEGMFNGFLHRNAGVCRLTEFDSTTGKSIRYYEEIPVGPVNVDIGHVLTSIEGGRRQKPASRLPVATGDATTESLIGWAGDIGSALAQYMMLLAAGNRANLPDLLQKYAGPADLLGDIDGMNIAAIYDENLSLADNLRGYYRDRPFRRFQQFLTTTLDEFGKPLFTLERSSPPRLDGASRGRAARYIILFAMGRLAFAWSGWSNATMTRLTNMMQPNSPEMTTALDYFFGFLERGLAKEK